MYFGHKHVEIRPNCSHGITTFLKYRVPLKTLDHTAIILKGGLKNMLNL